jgi:uncharacterized protein with PQ loop repeat
MNYLGIALGICLTIAGIGTYIPQFHNIVSLKSVDGISELSLILMNIGSMCLTMNLVIRSWNYFFCNSLECFSNLLPLFNVSIAWLMTLIYYIIFITYKIKNREKRIISGLKYALTYFIFTILIVSLALGEKIQNNSNFFIIYEKVLGISSAVLNAFVYLPQIYTLVKSKNNGNISILMYIMQTPGNLFLILFQIIFHNPITTWITYLIVLFEQLTILILLIYNYYKNLEENRMINSINSEEL